MSAISESDVNANIAEAEQDRDFDPGDKLPREHRPRDCVGHVDYGYTPAVLTAIIPELRGFSWLGGASWPVKVRVL